MTNNPFLSSLYLLDLIVVTRYSQYEIWTRVETHGFRYATELNQSKGERRYFCYFQERVELSVVREGLIRKQLATTGAYTE